MHFSPGTDVEAGDLLFVIDPREYEAQREAARAELAAAQAEVRRAEIEYRRAKNLYKKKAGSEADVVRWQGALDVARAAVERAQATLDQAQLDLDYTQVVAPISGRVGRNRVDVGNLVGRNEPTILTEITRFNPMYAYFNLNERDFLRLHSAYRKRVEEKGLDPRVDPDREADIKVFLGLANQEGYPHEGVADFAESGLDTNTGTLEMRGVFENPGPVNAISSGLFARIRMPVARREGAPLVSERAIGSDQSGRFVLVVTGENVIEKRNIVQGQLDDGMRFIEDGIEPGEWIVVSGLQRARPGAKVEPERIDMASLRVSAMAPGAKAGDASASNVPAQTGDAIRE
jgi:RND family efflux transporter MFP subunit